MSEQNKLEEIAGIIGKMEALLYYVECGFEDMQISEHLSPVERDHRHKELMLLYIAIDKLKEIDKLNDELLKIQDKTSAVSVCNG